MAIHEKTTKNVKTVTAMTKSKKNSYACKKDDKCIINLKNSHNELLKSYAEIDGKNKFIGVAVVESKLKLNG